MFSKNNPIIIFIDRNGFSIFAEPLVNVLRFNFTPETVANLDVINKDGLTNLITAFVQTNKISPSNIIVVLSEDIAYEKDLKRIEPIPANQQPFDLQEKEIQKFLENVPFEEVLAKIVKTANITRIVAVNKDFLDSVTAPFIKNGSILNAIVPSFLYASLANFSGGLKRENGTVVLRKTELLKSGNLLTNKEMIHAPLNAYETEKKAAQQKPQNIRQYVFIGIFLVLLVILGVVLLVSRSSSTKPPALSNNIISVTPTSVPTIAKLEALDIGDIKVEIIGGEDQDISIDLRNKLLQIGLKNISDSLSGSSAAKSSILFSKNIPSEIRQKVILEVEEILGEVVILENQDITSEIKIILGQ